MGGQVVVELPKPRRGAGGYRINFAPGPPSPYAVLIIVSVICSGSSILLRSVCLPSEENDGEGWQGGTVIYCCVWLVLP